MGGNYFVSGYFVSGYFVSKYFVEDAPEPVIVLPETEPSDFIGGNGTGVMSLPMRALLRGIIG